MKKLVALTLVLILCISSACAESVLLPLFDAASELLFNTDNVTITATASFDMDGVNFKHAAITHIQDVTGRFRDVYLTSPRQDGSFKENGYLLLAQGSHLQSVRSYHHIVTDEDYYDIRSTILNRTVGLNNLIQLCRGILELAEPCLPSGCINVSPEDSVTVALKGTDLPAAANALLTELLIFYCERTSYLSYDSVSPIGWGDVEDYGTVASGLLYTFNRAELDSVELTVQTDDETRLQQVSGHATIRIFTRVGTFHTVTASLVMEAKDYGTSILPDETALLQSKWWPAVD